MEAMTGDKAPQLQSIRAESARFWAEMGRGRGRQAIPAALGALAVGLLGSGCGSESHPNDPRPPIAAEVTVNITDSSISAQPARVGVRNANTAALTQERGLKEPEADPKAPLVVNFTTSNTTDDRHDAGDPRPQWLREAVRPGRRQGQQRLQGRTAERPLHTRGGGPAGREAGAASSGRPGLLAERPAAAVGA